MIYITGDAHGEFYHVKKFCEKWKTNIDDIMIFLGDVGLNYFDNFRDEEIKKYVSNIPITLFCIHGNHEMRPSHLSRYQIIDFCGGKVYKDEKYPNQLFAIDGEIYNFNGDKCLVIGGAYSVDKYYRLSNNQKWFVDEQPSNEIKAYVEKQIKSQNIDIVLSHTCPFNYIPREWFISYIDQSTVDNATEKWLAEIEETLNYKKWFCGHYHGIKIIDKIEFMFDNIKEFMK